MDVEAIRARNEAQAEVERQKRAYDDYLNDEQFRPWENSKAFVAGIADAQNVYIDVLLTELADAEQGRQRAEKLNRRANSLIGSCWSLINHTFGDKERDLTQQLEAWNLDYATRGNEQAAPGGE